MEYLTQDFLRKPKVKKFKKHKKKKRKFKPRVFTNYKTYLHSKEWKQKKRELIKNWSCCVCEMKIKRRLEVHHLTYKRIYKEEAKDLIVVCRRCHSLWHETEKPSINKLKFILQEEELDKRLDYLLG